MRRIFAGMFVALLAVVALGVGGAQASDSVSNVDGTMTGQKAASSDPGFYGRLTAKPTACVVAERKLANGVWVRDGFWQGQFSLSELRVCYSNVPAYEDYRIHTSTTIQVYGLRFVSNQGTTGVLCSSQAGCLQELA
jgi:hypothetical protein